VISSSDRAYSCCTSLISCLVFSGFLFFMVRLCSRVFRFLLVGFWSICSARRARRENPLHVEIN